MAGNLLMQFTLNTQPAVQTTNMLLPATDLKWMPVSHRFSYVRLCRVAAIRMSMTASPTGGNFHRYGFLWRKSCAVLLSLAALWDRCRSCAAYSIA